MRTKRPRDASALRGRLPFDDGTRIWGGDNVERWADERRAV